MKKQVAPLETEVSVLTNTIAWVLYGKQGNVGGVLTDGQFETARMCAEKAIETLDRIRKNQ